MSSDTLTVRSHRFKAIENGENLTVTNLLAATRVSTGRSTEQRIMKQLNEPPIQMIDWDNTIRQGTCVRIPRLQLVQKPLDDDLIYSSEEEDGDSEVSELAADLIRCPILDDEECDCADADQTHASISRAHTPTVNSVFSSFVVAEDAWRKVSTCRLPPRSPPPRTRVRFSRDPPRVFVYAKPLPYEKLLVFYSKEEIDNIMLQFCREEYLVPDASEIGEGEVEV
jgi:hypothetical protein